MVAEILSQLFKRELERLISEVEQYASEENMWSLAPGINNSAGNLCLHIIGNLNAFIGASLGNTGYQRNREAEFSTKNIPRATIIKQLHDTIQVVENTLQKLGEEDLTKQFPIVVFKDKGATTTAYFLMHLSTHLNYHLGQVNYHRRLLDKM